jgi:hypothetical protein
MKWTRIKEHLLPSIMQEIDVVTDKYTSIFDIILLNYLFYI